MADILHRIGVKNSTPEKVYDALTTIDGLAAWWTEDTKGTSDTTNGVVQFRFPPVGGFDMEVTKLTPSSHVAWRVVDGPPEWIDTTITFDVSQDDDYTVVLFKHEGWKEPVDFMYHCSTKWGSYLMSMKTLLETGKGAPAPNDVQISNWH
ncbi:SRPBCC domain-containing protein [Actinomadura barringtoniae]|uniref:SRPBCC domain-containing protein n=1 Tax=Actinomadura barringtoniae TaxID=1427535 RepID=A0A939T5D1_9ACTN|nr:SRPBCC domain-containing protein [Actinomadura barringtoniae]MBO2450488.1 SRPBCC domain-containing protein [Actinomadura barringtoniae]